MNSLNPHQALRAIDLEPNQSVCDPWAPIPATWLKPDQLALARAVYASDLAEQRIKHEVREADDNVYKKGFVVDVNVQLVNGKPAAYRVTNVRQVIDLPSD